MFYYIIYEQWFQIYDAKGRVNALPFFIARIYPFVNLYWMQ